MAKFVVTGTKELMRSLKKMGADVGQSAFTALDRGGQHFENAVKITLSDRWGPRTGKVYATGKKGSRFATHQASAPGEPPAKRSGLLMGSVTHKTEKVGKMGAKGATGTNIEYAELLERGGINEDGFAVAPRPYLFSTMVKEAPEGMRIVSKSLHQDLLRYRKKK